MGSNSSRPLISLLKCIMSVESKIVKSKSDSKDYRLVALNNGLRALLISDLKGVDASQGRDTLADSSSSDSCSSDEGDSEYESEGSETPASEDDEEGPGGKPGLKRKKKQAAAALCVDVGSFSDPDNVPGLAHFLEHMVFMGSEKYPNENKFDAFITKHGGSDNAHTDTERTVFEFEIQPEYFATALDIWAQFFIAPLLKYDSIQREVLAVDSEYDMSRNSDGVRKEQLVGKCLFPRDHPMSKFMWGNKKTLCDTPAENGIDAYGALESFHKKHYLANNMTLTLQSPEELDTLEAWVSEIFEKIPSGNRDAAEFPLAKPESNPFRLLKIVPVKNFQEIQVIWVLPPQQKYYRTKPLHYMSWLIGHEGKGSILSLLKDKKLALSLCSGNEGSGFEHNSTCSMFKVSVILTDEGLSRYCEVLDIVFQYIAMLQNEGPCCRIFEEIRKIEDIDFAYEEEEPAMENAEKLCENVLLYPEEEVLTGDDLLFEFDEECINNALKALTPETCTILLSAPSFKSMESTAKEPWFGTQYEETAIPEDWQTKWRKGFSKDGIDESLHLPPPNKFIAENFEVKSETDGSSVDNTKYPRLLSSPESGYKLWFRQDDIFKLPKAYVRIRLVNAISSRTPQNAVYLEIFNHLLKYNLAEAAYDADAASLTYNAEAGDSGGLVLKFCGFNDKLEILVDTVASCLVDFETTERDFEQRLLQHRRSYHNALIKPSKLAKMLRLSILRKYGWSSVDKYNACEGLKYVEFLAFVKNFLSSLSVEALVQGNFTDDEADSVVSKFCDRLKSVPLPQDKIVKQRIIKLESPQQVCKVSCLNKSDENSMVVMYFQGDPYSVRNSALARLVECVMEEPCFDVLRTKQQLGYTVYVQHHLTCGIIGLSVNVATQSSKFTIEETAKRINDFVTKKMSGIVRKMSAKEFDSQRNSLIAVLRNDDTHLGEEVGRNWGEILSRKYRFDAIEKEIAFLEGCTQSDFKNFYAGLCSKNNRVLHLQVEGNCDKVDEPVKNGVALPPIELRFLTVPESDCRYMTSIENFKNSSSYFPVAGSE